MLNSYMPKIFFLMTLVKGEIYYLGPRIRVSTKYSFESLFNFLKNHPMSTHKNKLQNDHKSDATKYPSPLTYVDVGCDSSAISVSTITRLRLAMVPVALD